MKKTILALFILVMGFSAVAKTDSGRRTSSSRHATTRTASSHKGFRTPDLGAFMLYGPVKKMTVEAEDEVMGIYTFSRDGILTDMYDGVHPCLMDKKQNKITIKVDYSTDYSTDYDGWKIYEYITDDTGTLVSVNETSEFGADRSKCHMTFSRYDANGFPTRVKSTCNGWSNTLKRKYTQIDRYGNWTEMFEGDNNGGGYINRTIEYY